MSYVTHTCLTVKCNGCGEELENGDGVILHFPTDDRSSMFDYGNEWVVWDAPDETLHWCADCLPTCVCGHYFGEHDYGTSNCEVCGTCARFVPEERAA